MTRGRGRGRGRVRGMDWLPLPLPLPHPHRKEGREGGVTVREGRVMVAGLLLLQSLRKYRRRGRRTPVTAGLIAANTLIYLRPSFLDPLLPRLNQVYFNPYFVVMNQDLKRFLLSPFYHYGEPHLLYSVLSLFWTGRQLESAMGSVEFASMVAALLGMSQGITLLLAKTLVLFDYERPYYYGKSVGFSGVLFAMRVVLYSRSDKFVYVRRIRLPARYAVCVELIFIQMLAPGASFLGHLGGVLAGILYVCLTRGSHSGGNTIIEGLNHLLGWPSRFFKRQPSPSRDFGRVRSVIAGAGVWDKPGLLSVIDMFGTEHNGNGDGVGDEDSISLDQQRQQRVQRFGR